MEFSEQLAGLRRAKGLSQEQLADLLGVSRQAVGKWERGISLPELDKMVQLADLFGVSLDELVRGQNCRPESEAGTPKTAARPEENQSAAVCFYRPGYEYRSRTTLFGLPLVHINIGMSNGGVRVAKGMIAIGNLAVGVLAIGGLALGIVGIGGLAAGALVLGGLALGGITVGGLSIGIFALGGLAVGVYAIGGCAVGASVCAGGAAFGPVSFGANSGVLFQMKDGYDPGKATALLDAVRPGLPGPVRAVFRLLLQMGRG